MPYTAPNSVGGLCYVRIISILASLGAALVSLYSAISFHLSWSEYPYLDFLTKETHEVTLRRCLDASGLLTPQDHVTPDDVIHDLTLTRIGRTSRNVNKTTTSSSSELKRLEFRILCTTSTERIHWGSYKIRCIDLKQWANVCAPNVHITVGISLEDMEETFRTNQQSKRDRSSSHNPDMSGQDMYNATIFVKALSHQRFPQYGTLFVDMLDEYGWKDDDIPKDMHLIFQSQWQGPWYYPDHKSSIVEHWYNSYPADSAGIRGNLLPKYIPPIQQLQQQQQPRTDDEGSSSNNNNNNNNNNNAILEIATIWNTRRSSHDRNEGGCPPLTGVPGVRYHCLDKDYDITKWYLDYFQHNNDARCDMVRTIANPNLGDGMLYYNLFRTFDALVVPAKNHTMRLHFGNVQRAISQMRSGVPVLLEVRGSILEEFMDRYNYTCAFQRYTGEPTFFVPNTKTGASSSSSSSSSSLSSSSSSSSSSLSHRRYWTFNEAVEQLKKVEVRRECQRQALEIVKDYSPSTIGQKLLRVVGYNGQFEC